VKPEARGEFRACGSIHGVKNMNLVGEMKSEGFAEK